MVAIAGGIAEQGAGVLPDEIIGPLARELKRVGQLSGALLEEAGKILKGGADLTRLLKPKEKKSE